MSVVLITVESGGKTEEEYEDVEATKRMCMRKLKTIKLLNMLKLETIKNKKALTLSCNPTWMNMFKSVN